MKKLFFHFLVVLCFFTTALIAQPTDPGLRVGERMPDISLGKLLNNPNGRIKTSDFKGKLLILDFWGVHCGVCIANMPEVDALQKQFGDKVQFLYVTRDSEAAVNALLKKRHMQQPSIPFIVADKVLDSLFPHTGNPLHVWIEQDRTVFAITQFYATNPETISAYLKGEKVELPRRWDWAYNARYPIVSEQNSALLSFADSYSIWLRGAISNQYVNGGVKMLKDTMGHVTGLRMFRRKLTDLFGFAYSPQLFQVPINYLSLFKNNRLIFDLKDSGAIVLPRENARMEEWTNKNLYTYELKLAPGSTQSVLDVLKKDLSLRFPRYKASLEYRKEKCIVLSDLCAADHQKARPGDSTLRAGVIYNHDNSVTVQNEPFDAFLEHLIYTYSYYDTPFINESSFRGNLQMHLNAEPLSLEQFNKELNRYGFQIRREEREIKMLVVTDKETEIAAH